MWHINKRADHKLKALVLTCDAALWRRRWAAGLFTAVSPRAPVLGWWSNIHYHAYGPARQRGAGRSWWHRQVAAAGAAAHAGLWAGGRPGGNIGNYTSCRQKERGQEGHFKIRERLFTYILAPSENHEFSLSQHRNSDATYCCCSNTHRQNMAWKNQQEATLSLGFSRQNGFNVLLFKFIPIQWLSSLACAEMHIKKTG